MCVCKEEFIISAGGKASKYISKQEVRKKRKGNKKKKEENQPVNPQRTSIV